jgi:hypothetical protein
MSDILCNLWFDVSKDFNPDYFQWILNSIKRNKKIDFIIFTNNTTKFVYEDIFNLQIVSYDRDIIIDKVNSLFDSHIPKEINSHDFGRNYICGLKPYIYSIFNEYISPTYNYIGWIDYDMSLDVGVDDGLIKVLNNPNISYCAKDSWCSQFSMMSLDLCKYVQVNLDDIQRWYIRHKRFRYFDETYSRDDILGLIYIIKKYNRIKNKNIYRYNPEDQMEMVGGGGVNHPKYEFTISYNNQYELDKLSITPVILSDDSLKYKEELKNKFIVWSLDWHFKLNLLKNPLLFKNYKKERS